MPNVIKQHLGWILSYATLATDDNWRDMLDRIESQIATAQRDAKGK